MIKQIKGFENYEISDKGEVFSKNYNRQGKRIKLKYQKDKYGYLYVRLSIKRGLTKHKTIHRLVAEHFIKNPEKKSQVNHKDGDKQNNSVENLEWVTPKENIKHSFENGLQKPNITNSKIDFNTAEEIRRRLSVGAKGKDIAKEFNLSTGNISAIKRGVIWKKEQ